MHSISGNGRKSVKKIPTHTTLLLTMKPEVESPLNRIMITFNRRGHRAFAVFLLSFFIGICRRAVSAVGCRSPPFQSGFYISKISDWRKKEWHTTTDVRTGNGLSGKVIKFPSTGNTKKFVQNLDMGALPRYLDWGKLLYPAADNTPIYAI